ncbi:hypothetical protein EV702DRAFT_1205173 [Suillus placidus]|uniref:Uncharacterized protein n=1 Tax=Suillus placidus TaxID=48579 RepID=A0A9P6ZFL9_9AGAM|nr:hypothetical protein EV702DRAFT_1205173 [Suillus placidus]
MPDQDPSIRRWRKVLPTVRKVSVLSDPETDRKTSSDPPEPSPSPPALPQSEFVFSTTQPPTSSSVPVRARANSTPVAGLSSLSHLLAQAPPEGSVGIIPSSRDVSPSTTPPLPPLPLSPLQLVQHDKLSQHTGRYHLYLILTEHSSAWATRTLITQKLKGLEDFIAVSVVSPHMGVQGWAFKNADPSWADADDDTEHPNFQHIKELYFLADPNYGERHVYSPLVFGPGAVGQGARHHCQQ